MSYVTWKLDRYAFLGTNVWSGSATTLTEFQDLDVQVSLGAGKDSFAFKVTNWNDSFSNYFKAQDRVVISRVTNTTSVTASDVIMDGVVKSVPTDTSGKNNTLRIEGYNFSEAIMAAITFTDVNGLTPPQAIQQALSASKALGVVGGTGITWDNTNRTTKKDGSAFPTITKSYKNYTLLKVMEELSSPKFTEDGAYYWWITADNKLKWVPNTSGTEYTFNQATGEQVKIKTKIDTDDVRNYFILKGGRDPAGKAIQKKHIDYVSANKHGNKFYIATSQTATSESLTRQDFGASATSTIPSSFPFTTVWKSQQTGAVVTVANGGEYVTAIRNEVEYRLGLEAEELARLYGKGKLKVDISFIGGSVAWALSDRINCTIPILSSTIKTLRVVEIQYGTDTDVYSLEEDIGTI
jgi:hypothetical protein